MNTSEVIRRRMEERNTLACAGIDPNIERFPDAIRSLDIPDEEKVMTFLREYIDTAAPYICAFKAQKAYFDVFEGGHALLHDVIEHAHGHGIPVIVDCKIGDIDETMKAYCRNLFTLLEADGAVVNPYMGDDVMQPLAAYADKVIVPLVKTSNPGGAVVQDIATAEGGMMWEEVLRLVIERWNGSGNMVPVIASTQDVDLPKVRKIVPDDMLIFFAGMGAQGGTADALSQLLDSRGAGVLVNSSRGLMYPASKAAQTWQESIKDACEAFRDMLNAQRE